MLLGYRDSTDTTKRKSEIEIGWTFLARSHWGGVYNSEMKQLIIRHAFRFVSHVIFVVGPKNLRSQKAVEKIGGFRVGSRMDTNCQDNLVYRAGVCPRNIRVDFLDWESPIMPIRSKSDGRVDEFKDVRGDRFFYEHPSVAHFRR